MSEAALEDAITAVSDGLAARITSGIVVFTTTGKPMTVRELIDRPSITPSAAQRLVEDHPEPGMIVTDLIDSSAIEVLRANDWSFWDRRGRLRIWLPEIGYRLDVPTPPFASGVGGLDRRHPVAGDAAAAHRGAPALANRKRYYCASRQTLSRFVLAHWVDGESTLEVALAPTPLVITTALNGIAHPVVAALDLSRTQRGREILNDWTQVNFPDPTEQKAPVWQ